VCACAIVQAYTKTLQRGHTMQAQTMYVLMLQGTGEDEYAFETAGVFTTHAQAVAKANAINAEYDVEDFAIDYKVEEWQLNT